MIKSTIIYEFRVRFNNFICGESLEKVSVACGHHSTGNSTGWGVGFRLFPVSPERFPK